MVFKCYLYSTPFKYEIRNPHSRIVALLQWVYQDRRILTFFSRNFFLRLVKNNHGQTGRF